MSALQAKTGTNPVTTRIFQVIAHAFSNLLVSYRRRQTMHELSALDDHLLDDIGVRRAELSTSSLSNDAAARNYLHLPRHQIG